ncbi:diguanylate cyclase, partial [Actinoplanes sp. NPDC049596]|uniref:diguanylate cyclase n=1 Tax=Actinoplanes sp. NPDC049596 TaxID=3154625 RepID=UPI0034488680
GGGGLAARLGGDEFAVLLPGAGGDQAEALAARITAAVGDPIWVTATQEVTVGASVGVATGSPRDAGQLLRDADAAMYRAKAVRRSASPQR